MAIAIRKGTTDSGTAAARVRGFSVLCTTAAAKGWLSAAAAANTRDGAANGWPCRRGTTVVGAAKGWPLHGDTPVRSLLVPRVQATLGGLDADTHKRHRATKEGLQQGRGQA